MLCLSQQVNRAHLCISARALAPLADLMALCEPALKPGVTGVFLKGGDWRQELTQLGPADSLTINTLESRTDKRARVVVVKRMS